MIYSIKIIFVFNKKQAGSYLKNSIFSLIYLVKINFVQVL